MPEAKEVLDEVVGDFRRVIHEYSFVEGHKPKKGKRVYYILIGPDGAVQFAYMWHESYEELLHDFKYCQEGMLGLDVGYHSYEPRFKDHKPMECPWLLDQDHCYYDGSSLRAEKWLRMWLEADRNDEVLWMALKSEYDAIFLEEEA